MHKIYSLICILQYTYFVDDTDFPCLSH